MRSAGGGSVPAVASSCPPVLSGPIMDMMQKFDNVTKACFSGDLLPGWRDTLEIFITSVWELISFCKFRLNINLSVTWKIHILVLHLRPLWREQGRGSLTTASRQGRQATTRWRWRCQGTQGTFTTQDMAPRYWLAVECLTDRGGEDIC